MRKKNPDYISFSGLKDWNFCPFYYKLTKIDGLDGFVGNEFTLFGSAIHKVCEEVVQGSKTLSFEISSQNGKIAIKMETSIRNLLLRCGTRAKNLPLSSYQV
jgi:hypothetical protein